MNIMLLTAVWHETETLVAHTVSVVRHHGHQQPFFCLVQKMSATVRHRDGVAVPGQVRRSLHAQDAQTSVHPALIPSCWPGSLLDTSDRQTCFHGDILGESVRPLLRTFTLVLHQCRPLSRCWRRTFRFCEDVSASLPVTMYTRASV